MGKGKHSFRKAFDAFSETKRDDEKLLSGILGLPVGSAQNTVEVAGRTGFVYVRLRDNLNEVIQAYNDQVSPVYGLPVLIARDRVNTNYYSIVKRDVGRYQDWGSLSPYMARHGNQHSFNVEDGGGGDIVWVEGRQFVPLALTPSGSVGAGNVVVEGSHFYTGGDWHWAGDTGTPDILAYKPLSGTSNLVLVYIDGADNNPKLVAGEGFDPSISGTANIIPFLPPVPDSEDVPLGAIQLVSGTERISWEQIYDLRPYIVGSAFIPTGTYGHIIRDEGMDLPQRSHLNFIGANVWVNDDEPNNETEIIISGSAGVGDTRRVIKDEGVAEADRDNINYLGNGVFVNDDPGNDELEIIISGSSSRYGIRDEGAPQTQRGWLNFVGAGVSVNDDPGSDELEIIITGSTTVSPGGNNAYVQFNDAGVFGGDDGLQWAKFLQTLSVGGTIKLSDKTAASPSYAFALDSNTGLYRDGSDILGISAGGVARAKIHTDRVEILTALNVSGTSTLNSNVIIDTTNTEALIIRKAGDGGDVFIVDTTNDEIELPTGSIKLVTTTTAVTGIIFKGANRFIHDFHHPTGDTAVPIGRNLFIGDLSGNFTVGSTATVAQDGSNNTCMGFNTGNDLTIGKENVCIGSTSGNKLTEGIRNMLLGYGSGDVITIGDGNAGIGYASLGKLISGNDNTGVGRVTLGQITTTSNNVAIGAVAGFFRGAGADALVSATQSVFIGGFTRASADAQTNEIVIGYNAIGHGSNSVTLGHTTVTLVHTDGSVLIDRTDTEALLVRKNADGGDVLIVDTTNDELELPTGSIKLASTTAAGIGIIYKGVNTFIHDFHHPTGGGAVPEGYNVFIGDFAGNLTLGSTATTTEEASNNIGIGRFSLVLLTKGQENICVGTRTGNNITDGDRNVYIGHTAGRYGNASNNVGIGYATLADALLSGGDSMALGSFALGNLTTGARNVAVGRSAGSNIAGGAGLNETSSNSIYLGGYTDASADGNTNEIVIGYAAIGAGSNTIKLGNTSIVRTVLSGTIAIEEQAAAGADVATFGQHWVLNSVPNAPMFTDDAGGDYALQWKDYVPSSVTDVAGTVTGGSVVADAQVMFDGNLYTVDEVAATPGFDQRFNFTGVDRYPSFVVARYHYNGSATHYVGIDIYNYTTMAWDMLHIFKDTAGYFENSTKRIPLVNQVDYVDGGGNAIVRFYHYTAGNASHDIEIDYVGLTHSLQGVI